MGRGKLSALERLVFRFSLHIDECFCGDCKYSGFTDLVGGDLEHRGVHGSGSLCSVIPGF